jgi:hypothetical protein
MEAARGPAVPGAVTSYSAKSALFTVGTADRGKYFDNTGSYTISLTAAATLGQGFSFWVRNVSGTQTIDPNGAELINGGATLAVSNANDVWLIECTGTAFVASRQYAQGIQCTTLAASGAVTMTAGTASTTTTTGTLVVTGGIGVSGQASSAAGYINNGSSATYLTIETTVAQDHGIRMFVNGLTRWIYLCNSTAESGGNAGSNFSLSAYDDSGAAIDSPLIIARVAQGAATWFRPTRFAGVQKGGATSFGLLFFDSNNFSSGNDRRWAITNYGAGAAGALDFYVSTTNSADPDYTTPSTAVLRLDRSSTVSVLSSTASTTTGTGALIVTGGAGFGGAINVGGVSAFTGTTENTSLTTGGTLTTAGGIRASKSIAGSGFLQAVNATAKTGPYTCLLNDFKVRVNATTSAMIVSLPTSPISGHILCISKTDSTANTVTISGTVDGVVDPTLTVQYQKKLIMYSGAWETIA